MAHSHHTRGTLGDELVHALDAYLTAVADVGLGRHERLEDLPKELDDLRTDLLRLADTLPHSVWPRPVCPSCHGRREVDAVPALAHETVNGGEPARVRRLCSLCWGTGMSMSGTVSG